MDAIVLEAHICDQRRSYLVTFEGAQAEDMALAFMAGKRSTHVISEVIIFDEHWVCAPHGGDDFYRVDEPAAVQPHMIDANAYPRLYAALNPTCGHGMPASGCYGPAHWASEEEIAQGW